VAFGAFGVEGGGKVAVVLKGGDVAVVVS